MKYIKSGLLIIALIVIGLVLGPILNLLTNHTTVKVISADKDFASVSNRLQNSCMDCHTPGGAERPWYTNMPIASDIIYSDIANGQGAFVISQKNLSGEDPFSPVELNKIKAVLDKNSMPPFRYLAMHWNAITFGSDKDNVLKWIEKQNPNYGLKPIPSPNPVNPDAAKAELGKRLYFDNRLSGDGSVSCSSCHALDKGGADNSIVSTGIKGQKGDINSPTVFNAVFNFAQFWDGRSPDLKDQVIEHISDPGMGSSWKEVESKLSADEKYVADFATLYPIEGTDKSKPTITASNISDAIAKFEQTLITPNSRFDHYLQGDKKAINSEEEAGYKLFVSNNCVSCHTGTNLGGLSFEKMGVKKNYFEWRGHINEADNGRYNVTHDERDRFTFKVPTLRNVALTAPYFHDGSASDLSTAVKIMAEYQGPKPLSDQEAQLVTKFLNTLTGEYDGKSLATQIVH